MGNHSEAVTRRFCFLVHLPTRGLCQKTKQKKKADVICLYIWLLIGFHRITCYITSGYFSSWLSVCPHEPKLHSAVSSRCAPTQYKYIYTVYTSNTHLHTHAQTDIHRLYIHQINTPPLLHVCVRFCAEQIQAHASSGSKDILHEGWQ